MELIFPSYDEVFCLTKRRLKGLKKLSEKNKSKFNKKDKLLFLIVGNINLRLNTIFHLLENSITDGVFPLQRSLFELQIAFQTYAHSSDKEVYVDFYNKKKVFESSTKWKRVIQGEKSEIAERFTLEDHEVISKFKEASEKAIKNSSNQRPFKLWHELASGKKFSELGVEHQTKEIYFTNYDELSNWVHPQRLEENLNTENFRQHLSENYFKILIGNLIWSIKSLTDDMLFLVRYFKISESPPFYVYGKKLNDFKQSLRNLL